MLSLLFLLFGLKSEQLELNRRMCCDRSASEEEEPSRSGLWGCCYREGVVVGVSRRCQWNDGNAAEPFVFLCLGRNQSD